MRQLTNHAVRRIVQALDEGYFAAASFDLSFPEEGETYVDARFIDNRDFFLNITKSEAGYRGSFGVKYSPGSITAIREYNTNDFDDCCKSLKTWSENIRNELVASSPVYIEFEQFKKKLNEEIEKRFTNAEERFTTEEIQELRNKLADLTKRMEELQRKNKLTEEELEGIKKTLEVLKTDAEVLPKKPWYRAAGNKLANLMTRFVTSKPGQKLLEEGARNLLDMPKE